jgi:hypothetical protein
VNSRRIAIILIDEIARLSWQLSIAPMVTKKASTTATDIIAV